MTSKVKITRGSSNVFADLGFPDAETHQLKAQLVVRIQDVMKSKKLTQAKVAKLIGASQPDVSRMLRGHFHDISSERLMLFLRRMGCDVDILVKPAKKRAYAPIHLSAESS